MIRSCTRSRWRRQRAARDVCSGVFVLAASLLAAACGTTRLRPQLQELAQFAQFSGRVVGAAPGERCIALLVGDPEGAAAIVNYAFAGADGEFLLLGRAGNHRILAFADRDRDAVLDDDEPLAWATVPAGAGGVTVRVPVGDLLLAPGASRPGFAVDLAGFGAAAGSVRARRLGEVVGLDDARFAAGVVERGVWEPLRFAEESGLQILFTEPFDGARVPVLFVHGMQGSPRDFRGLVGALDRTRFQAWVYYYPTGLDLAVNGLVLRELLAELRQRLGFERLHVVAHSMGGLVALSAIVGGEREGSGLGIDRFVTLSTPWLGAVGTRGMQAGLAISPNSAPAWLDMLPESGFLAELGEREIPPGIRFSMLFGYSGSNAMVAGADDGTVAVRSMAPWAMIRQAEYVLPFAADHEGILDEAAVIEVLQHLLRDEPPTPGAARR